MVNSTPAPLVPTWQSSEQFILSGFASSGSVNWNTVMEENCLVPPMNWLEEQQGSGVPNMPPSEPDVP